MILLSGKELAQEVKDRLKTEIRSHNLELNLSVILIGSDPASEKYVAIKEKACSEIGIGFKLHSFADTTNQSEIIDLIEKLNLDDSVTGIIVQLPLPDNFIPNELLEAIDPKKDVDGLNSSNLGKLVKDLEGLYPATAEGVINLLRYYQIPVVGKRFAVVGQSNLVGKPLAQMLLNEEATVLIANDKTENLKELTLESDVVICAVGSPSLITAEMVREGAVVIDIGTTLVKGKMVGDVDFANVSKKASHITPNPGGVGPMTVAMLLSNVVKSWRIYGN
jgi:methylenetetrahydrofolate dehydrogenase (NADP+)/methenyltetrahydrofolate cyclohydrolase